MTSEKYCRFASRKLLRLNGPRLGVYVSYGGSIVHFEAERINEVVTPWVAPKPTRSSRSPTRRFRTSYGCLRHCDPKRVNARADSRFADAKPVSGSKIDIKWRYFSFVKINCKHTLTATRRWHAGGRRTWWETRMKNSLVRRFELASSLLRTLSQVLDARSRLIRSEIRGSDPSLLLRLGPVDERRLRPVLIPVGSRRRRT